MRSITAGRRWAAVVSLALLAGTACRSGPPHPYPADVVANFVASCTRNAPEDVCRCAIDRIQRRFSLDEFHVFEARMTQGEAPKELIDSVADCQDR